MTTDTTIAGLDTLQSIGIITAGQRRRALADPGAAELAAMASLSSQLVWMIQRDIVTPDDMAHACTRIETGYGEQEAARHMAVVSETLAKYLDARAQVNRDALGALVSAALITQAELDRTLPQLPQELLLESPGEALVWMARTGHIGGRRLKAFRRDGAAGDARRGAILREVERLDREHNDAVTAYWRALLPGPVWMWIAVPLLAFSVYVWHTVTPSTPPACADQDIGRTLDGLMLRASIDQRISAMRPGAEAALPRVGAIQEVGYASEPRIRGCRATLTIDQTQTPYAFTIEPSAPGKQDFAVVGASPAIVEARFGHLSGDGRFINKAEPVGRAEAERAFRAGVEQMMAAAAPGLRRTAPDSPASGIARLAASSPERSREIAEVEPLAPCREIAAGTAYSCRLLVERNDPLLAAIGRHGSTTLEGDFVFERDGPSGPWRMAEGFDTAFVNAVAASRIQALTR